MVSSMIYIVMKLYHQTQFVNAVAAFDNDVAAHAYANKLDTYGNSYSYRVDYIHLNPDVEK